MDVVAAGVHDDHPGPVRNHDSGGVADAVGDRGAAEAPVEHGEFGEILPQRRHRAQENVKCASSKLPWARDQDAEFSVPHTPSSSTLGGRVVIVCVLPPVISFIASATFSAWRFASSLPKSLKRLNSPSAA